MWTQCFPEKVVLFIYLKCLLPKMTWNGVCVVYCPLSLERDGQDNYSVTLTSISEVWMTWTVMINQATGMKYFKGNCVILQGWPLEVGYWGNIMMVHIKVDRISTGKSIKFSIWERKSYLWCCWKQLVKSLIVVTGARYETVLKAFCRWNWPQHTMFKSIKGVSMGSWLGFG